MMAEPNGAGSADDFGARVLARAMSMPAAKPQDEAFNVALFKRLEGKSAKPAAEVVEKPPVNAPDAVELPDITNLAVERLRAKQAATAKPTPIEALPAPMAAPVAPLPAAPVDPVLATLSKLADALALMSAPRVIVRDENGRIIRSEVQPVKIPK